MSSDPLRMYPKDPLKRELVWRSQPGKLDARSSLHKKLHYQTVQSRHEETIQNIQKQALNTHRKTAQEQRTTLQQMEPERLVGAIAQRIRHTLDLNTLVAIAAQELGELLWVDRVEIVQYLSELRLWRHLAEYRRDLTAPSFMQCDVPDDNNPLAEQLKRLETVQICNSSIVGDEINQPFAEVSPGSWLLLPLKIEGILWGSLSLVKHQVGGWQPSEVELIYAAAEQLAIAIQHSQLYQKVQQLNAELEYTVAQRTAQLQQSLANEEMLKRITDKVRDSLDEGHILATTVEELANLLKVDCCDTGLYNDSRTTCTIAYEHTSVFPPSQGKTISMTTSHREIYEQLLNCQHVQFCCLESDTYPEAEAHTILACPIFDNQGVLGDLWLFRANAQIFDDLEVRLVQQVANQCAIAIRQARLYQSAQNQVEALEHVNQLKDSFLNTVSHELRTPVTTIKMAIQMLTLALGREGLLPNPHKPSPNANKIAHYLKILNDECNREIGLITDLLDLQQLEAGIHTVTIQPVELKSYLQRILRPFQEQAEAQGQILQIQIAPDLPAILSDPQSLERILVELLSNACKYTPQGETITVTASMVTKSLEANLVAIKVSNSGVQIPLDQLERIFDKFYRIPSNDPHRHGGTGLGLALVKKLVLQIGGKIYVESSNGETSFTVEIPATSGQRIRRHTSDSKRPELR
ncbi:histidine kinase with GAF domain [Leptolyngbyaceae cyanobacterium JSC-12]|nr:histidine kinase with GAF domain [Leptolyngbyaceae cyanobacterium JSC-12]